MKDISRKTEQFTDSVIRRMTRISLACGAINLAQGYPDFDPPKAITDRLAQVSAIGPHQYPITMGAPNFRQALAKKCGHFMGLNLDPETNMVITIGSTEAMVDTIFALTNPGDKIIMFSPYFENYRAQAIMADCEPIFVPLVPPTFHFDPNVLEDAFKQGAKAILICNPSNPSGKVFTEEELKLIGDMAIRYDTYVIMDEVYEHIVYAPHKHVYMSTLPGMWERTLTVCSMSKGYGLSGFRIGYIYADDHIMDVLYGGAVNVLGAACTVTTLGAVAALNDDSILPEYRERLDRRRTLAYDILSTTPGVSMRKSESGILSWLDVHRLGTSEEVADYLMQHANVMVNQGVPYGSQGAGWIRIVTACFARDEDAALRFERIKAALTELAKQKGIV